MEVALPPVKTILNRLQPLSLEWIILSGGLADDEWLQPGDLTNTGNRAHKSRESSAPCTLSGQETSTRKWMLGEHPNAWRRRKWFQPLVEWAARIHVPRPRASDLWERTISAVCMCVSWLVLTNLGVLARASYCNKGPTGFIDVGEWKRISSSHACAVSASRGGSEGFTPTQSFMDYALSIQGFCHPLGLSSPPSGWKMREDREHGGRFCKPDLGGAVVQNPVTWLYLTIR